MASTLPFKGGSAASPLPGWVLHGEEVAIITSNRDRYLELRQRAREMRRDPTPAEAELWRRLRGGRLAGWHFERQHVVGEFIVDFYCHAAGLVVEVDGEVHVPQTGRDAERDAFLASQGLRVLRFPNERVLHDTYAVLREIRRAAKDSPRPSPGPGERPGSGRPSLAREGAPPTAWGGERP